MKKIGLLNERRVWWFNSIGKVAHPLYPTNWCGQMLEMCCGISMKAMGPYLLPGLARLRDC